MGPTDGLDRRCDLALAHLTGGGADPAASRDVRERNDAVDAALVIDDGHASDLIVLHEPFDEIEIIVGIRTRTLMDTLMAIDFIGSDNRPFHQAVYRMRSSTGFERVEDLASVIVADQ